MKAKPNVYHIYKQLKRFFIKFNLLKTVSTFSDAHHNGIYFSRHLVLTFIQNAT
jgi:hypothetical protein